MSTSTNTDANPNTAMVSRRTSIAIGVAIAVALTLVTFVLPYMVPYEEITLMLFDLTGRWFFDLEGPFDALRFVGGFVGGLCVGLFTRGRARVGASRGVAVALWTLGLLYLLMVLLRIGQLMTGEFTTFPIVPILITPFIVFVIPLLVPYLAGGFLGGFLGAWWMNTREGAQETE
jgi:hypothetical protein